MWRVFIFLCLLAAWLPGPARADVQQTVDALLAAGPDRSAASESAETNARLLESSARQAVAGAAGQVYRQTFVMTVPVVKTCRVMAPAETGTMPSTEPAERALPFFPLVPMGGQPPVLGSPGKPRQLAALYGHFGRLEDLRGMDLSGRIVALELNAPEASVGWQHCAALGAAAIVFLGDADARAADFLSKSTAIPLSIPRFYCDDPSTVDWLRHATGDAAHTLSIELQVRWEEKTADNVICIIPGRGGQGGAGGLAGGGNDWTQQWVILQARFDGVSPVMTRSPGATPALNSAVLLDLARHIAAAPAHCGVVLAWTAGDEWNNHGSHALMDLVHRGLRDPGRAVSLLEEQSAAAEKEQTQAATLCLAAKRVASHGWDQTLPQSLRDALEEELLRQSSSVEDQLQRARLARKDADVVRFQADKQELLTAMNIASGRVSIAPDESQATRIHDAAVQVDNRWEVELARRTMLAHAMRDWSTIRAVMPQRDPLLWLSLSLSAGTQGVGGGGGNQPLKFGLLSRSFYSTGLDVTGPMSPFAQAFRRYSAGAPAFQPESMETAYALEALLPLKRGFSSDAAIAFGQPAAAVATLLDPATCYDSPNDTPDRVRWDQVNAQEESLSHLLLGSPGAPGALTDSFFYGRTELRVQVSDQLLTLFEPAEGESLPRLRAAGALVGGESEVLGKPLGEPLAGTRRTEWYLAHADGAVLFDSVVHAQDAELRLQAFQFDDDGQVTQALAANQDESRGMVASFSPRSDRPVRALLFNCRRFDAYGLFDPRNLDNLDQLQILDARRLDEAQFSNIYVHQGTAALFYPPDIRWQLLASRGDLSSPRMILINAEPQHPTGLGFDASAGALGPLAWRTAQDFSTLDARRKADLEKFGISNEVIRELQADSEKQLALARQAQTARDYPAFHAASDAVWSLQSQEHDNLINTSNGIIKGVIFLLLGVIPFSYFLERLLISSSNVYHQIGWFALIFACMTAGLWFHPAFRISSAPLMILLAFLILILSSTVVYILWGKFEDEIARLRGTAGEAGHVASFRRGAVLGAAVRLGLSNMRRRGTRTALTLTTLVLLTFTLLCFTSVRESVQITPRDVAYWRTSSLSPPVGILLRQTQWATLPSESIEFARGLALPSSVALAEPLPKDDLHSGPVAARWWYASQRQEQPWLLPIQFGDRRYLVNGLLGLDPAESQFQSPSEGPANVAPGTCWLPTQSQSTLNVDVGDNVLVLGFPLRVAGFFTPATFARLRQLTGDPMAPLEGQKAISGGGAAAGPGGGGAASGQGFQAEPSYRYLDSLAVAIVPSSLVERLGGRLTSIMLRPADITAAPNGKESDRMEAVATSLARRSAFGIYVSTGRKVLSINAAEASRPQDLGVVIVPMVIAAVIVLNAMLGAVSERTREIHVYTSVGLSPAHVGMLFLAEAAALGTLGVVFGYIFGQGLATVLSWTHWLPGVDLNYSSLSAIVTMGLVLGVVMLSALLPARSASRLAAPSLSRDWKLPRPMGDLLAVDLPFTVNETAARGVCAFLAEFLSTTSQAGTGRFTADNIQGFVEPAIQGHVRGLLARIWLAPYDLGVIQAMELSIHPTDQPNVYDVHVQLTREAGNPSAWRRLNRPFLVEIRRQFLLWRALDHARIEEYVKRSESLFTA